MVTPRKHKKVAEMAKSGVNMLETTRWNSEEGKQQKTALKLSEAFSAPEASDDGGLDTPFGDMLSMTKAIRQYFGQVSLKEMKKLARESQRQSGVTGTILRAKMESRLTTVVYRMGFSKSMRHARMLVSHGHILVNDSVVRSPCYSVKVGDTVSVKPVAQVWEMVRKSSRVTEAREKEESELDYQHMNSSHLSVDYSVRSGVLTRSPNVSEMEYPHEFDMELIVRYLRRY